MNCFPSANFSEGLIYHIVVLRVNHSTVWVALVLMNDLFFGEYKGEVDWENTTVRRESTLSG